MCVTNTARRRPVAKFPASALAGMAHHPHLHHGHGAAAAKSALPAPKPGLAAASSSIPYALGNGGLMAAQVRQQQETASRLLLRRKQMAGAARDRVPSVVHRAVREAGQSPAAAEEKEEADRALAGMAAAAKEVANDAGAPPPPASPTTPPATVHDAQRGAGHGHAGGHPEKYEHGTVTHAYHDHAADPLRHGKVSTRGGVTCPFPQKLHDMLDQIEQDGLGHVISWQPHGRAFLVHNTRAFVEVVMPRYFKQTKMPSFQRQLNLYGFQRITAGLDRGAYYHELFLRGMPFLAAKMTRTRVKGTGVRMASSPETEPNFYAMKPVNPMTKKAGPGAGPVAPAPPASMMQGAVPPPLSKSTLQSLLANPLAKVHPHPLHRHEEAAVAAAAAALKPPAPHHPGSPPMMPVVTPCSMPRPRQSLGALERDNGGRGTARAAVPPPPLAAVSAPSPAPVNIAPRTQLPPPPPKLEHFIHRPQAQARAPAPRDHQNVVAAHKDPKEAEHEDKASGGGANATPFEKSMLQYLDSLRSDKTIDDAAINAALMEPLPFRLLEEQGLVGEPRNAKPPRLDFPESEFIPPTPAALPAPGPAAGAEGGSVEEVTASTAPATAGSSLGSSPGNSSGDLLENQAIAAAAAALAPAPAPPAPKKEEEREREERHPHPQPLELGHRLDDADGVRNQDDDHVMEEDDDMPVPKHLLSPKSKEAEMDRFLEELMFEGQSGPEGTGADGGLGNFDPLSLDDGMKLDDEALGYLLDGVVGE